jgi:flagellar protein FlaI
MGLLEKAQEQKKIQKQSFDEDESITQKSNPKILNSKPIEIKKQTIETKDDSKGLLQIAKQIKKQEETIDKNEETKGLLQKAKQIKTQEETQEPEKTKPIEKYLDKKNCEIIEEKKGFGYNGLATRRILQDKNSKEYFYEIIEPILTEVEKEIKTELAHLFKMLAKVNVGNMAEEEKNTFLKQTLDQIIKDNDIDFTGRKIIKKEEDKTKAKKSLFSKKTPEEIQKQKLLKKQEKISKLEVKKKKLQTISKTSKKNKQELSEEEKKIREKIYYHLFRDFLGYNKIDVIMKDEGIEDISCDGPQIPIFIYHKKYDAITTNIKFDNEIELNSFVVRLAQICGKQISIYSPIVDGKLPDGSRLQTTLAKTVTKGSTFTIRKFKENPLTPIDLISFQSMSLDMAAYFWMAIEKGASILFCGGTASGKTTTLNALSLFIPEQHKIVTIEDTREINLPHQNWIAGTTRQGFSASDEKTGKDIDMFDLIRAALRQRPKVVMVGEVRGKEAYSLFQAMATGHTSYATVHASDIHTLIQRLENPPISLPRALLTSLDIIVFQNAVDISGKTVRRTTSITEIVKLDSDTNQLIFMEPYRWVSKTDDRFESSGSSKILNNIRVQSDWTEEQLENELENRKLVLRWMKENNIRDYIEVGNIVNQYARYPDELMKKVKGEVIK